MLILANTLICNGGTTFILRMAKAYASEGDKLGVLVLTDSYDEQLLDQIQLAADVYFLKDYVPAFYSTGSQLDIFMPYCKPSLSSVISLYGNHVHAIGVFGLLFSALCAKRGIKDVSVSAGVYHQNEYMYKNVNAYFSTVAYDFFAAMGAPSVVFFNENCIASYTSFFKRDYSCSPLLPIGIELPDLSGEAIRREGFRIVSIGNLHPFKTYNENIISIMPSLLEVNSGVTYEIYGEGGNEDNLKRQVKGLGIEDAVFFKGTVGYDKLNSILRNAFLFVGSGTAILESSALGVPSLIGIESIKQAVTYGFLSAAEGFSYHEEVQGKTLYNMQDMIVEILEDEQAWNKRSLECQRKAEDFSVRHTFLGFKKVEVSARVITPEEVNNISSMRLMLSFIWSAIKHKLGLDKEFAERRNQGSIV